MDFNKFTTIMRKNLIKLFESLKKVYNMMKLISMKIISKIKILCIQFVLYFKKYFKQFNLLIKEKIIKFKNSKKTDINKNIIVKETYETIDKTEESMDINITGESESVEKIEEIEIKEINHKFELEIKKDKLVKKEELKDIEVSEEIESIEKIEEVEIKEINHKVEVEIKEDLNVELDNDVKLESKEDNKELIEKTIKKIVEEIKYEQKVTTSNIKANKLYFKIKEIFKKIFLKSNIEKKKSEEEKIENIISKKYTPLKIILIIFKILLISIIVFSFTAVGMVGGIIYGYVNSSSKLSMQDFKKLNLTSFIYDKNGQLLSRLNGDENREWVKLSETPKYLQNAFIAIEDTKFLTHDGVDYIGIPRAIYKSVGGASTITMQLVRNVSKDFERSVPRKIQESYRAIELEKELRKNIEISDEVKKTFNGDIDKENNYRKSEAKKIIMERYINIIGVGYSQNVYGVRAASKLYFDKDVSELSLAQCACIAGITQYPFYYDPLTPSGRKHNLEKQKLTLKKMNEQKMISKDEYQKAINEDVKFVEFKKEDEEKKDIKVSKQTYFVDAAINQIISDIMEETKSSKEDIRYKLYNNGWRVYTTFDETIQKEMDEVFNDPSFFDSILNQKCTWEGPSFGKTYNAQAAMALIDNSEPDKSGQVRAIYGGYGPKKVDMGKNRAVDNKRNPGSTWKPICVYGPNIDMGKLIDGTSFTAGSAFDDVPLFLNPQAPTTVYPKNESKTFKGLLTVRRGIEESNNVIAAQVWRRTNKSEVDKYLKNMGFKTPNVAEGTSYALGGSVGTNPLKMAGAYSSIVNKGKYYEPTMYLKIVDNDGNIIIDKTKKKPVDVFKETTSYIMTDIMKGVLTSPYGTATYVKVRNENQQIITAAAKTGTTDKNTDRWFAGFTPYYTGVVWFGDDYNLPLPNMNYNPSAKIWNEVMNRVHKKLQPKEFDISSNGIVYANVCTSSGDRPSSLCGKYSVTNRESVRYEKFVAGTEPRNVCLVHVEKTVDTSKRDEMGKFMIAGPFCPKEMVKNMVFIKRKEPVNLNAGSLPQDYYMTEPDKTCTDHTKNENPINDILNNINNVFNGNTTFNPPKVTTKPRN